MRKTAPLLLVLLLVLGAGQARAEPKLIFEDENITVYGDPALLNLAKHLAGIYPETERELERVIGWGLPFRPNVLLVENRGTFERMSGNPYFSAFAVPRMGLVVINLPSVSDRSYLLKETFEHELCHLVLHGHIESGQLPKWLDEGVCQWVSGSLGEMLIAGGSGAAMVDVARNPIPLDRLADDFPDGERPLLLAYETSRSFVEYLSSRYGKEGVQEVLNRLGAGESVDGAFESALSRPLSAVEADWRDRLKGRGIWLIWLGQYLYEILFFVAALLSVLAFIRVMMKKRRYGEDEDEEDGGGP